MMSEHSGISLVIPLKNEESSISTLIESIRNQSSQPSEVILVDGGSTDNTVQQLKNIIGDDPKYKIVEAGMAMPGKGRNIGAGMATSEWIAFTDGGIKLNDDWLQQLERKMLDKPGISFVYGNYNPVISRFFEKCAAISYVPPLRKDTIRGKFIASTLFKKEVWKKIGGFPDWRAAEDLIFMEQAEKSGYSFETAPDAMVYWELRQDMRSTYKRFDLYSMYNVWAGRQAHWHYGVMRHYLLMFAFCFLGFFHHWAWFLGIPVWMLARSAKRIFQHRFEFGLRTLFNPAVLIMVSLITFVTDMATFTGWIKALVRPNPLQKSKGSQVNVIESDSV